MAVESDLGVVAELGDHGGDTVGDLVHDERASGVDDVDALAAGIRHDAGLLGEHLGGLGVAHHEEADGLQAQLSGVPEVLDGDVGLGAVGGDAADRSAVVASRENVVLYPQAGQGEERDLGLLGGLRRDLDELLVVGLGEAVVERRAAETVTVRDLDDRHAGAVEGGHDVADVLDRELVPLVMRAVPQ